ncbi:transmembrane protein 255B-like isoform 3-T3 [Callospermophilus lateralis]
MPSPPVPRPLALLDTTEGFARRKRTSLWSVGSLFLVSALILTIGLAATTRTENVTVGGYYPGIIVSPWALALSWESLVSTWWRTEDRCW